MKTYHDRRAPEYDDRWLGEGLYANRDRPRRGDELRTLDGGVAALPPMRALDAACGTGFLTRHLRGDAIGLDASKRWTVYKRFFTGDELAAELDGDTLFEGRPFVVARS